MNIHRKHHQRHLIVDVFNVMHKNVECSRFLKNNNWEGALDVLVAQLRVIHDVEELRLSFVVDGRGRSPEIIYPSKEPTLAIIFAPSGLTADGLIEQMVNKSKYKEGVTVASDDRALTQLVSSLGGVSVTVDGLFEWAEVCRRRQSEKLARKTRENKQKWKDDDPWKPLNNYR